MKTIPAPLLAHYQSGSSTIAVLWKITRTDGAVYAFTDHDRAIERSGITYRPTSAFDASAVASRAELNTDNMEVVGLLDDAGITAEDIEAGRWDGASVRVVEVNWADPTMGERVVRVGEIGNIQRKRGQYVAELRGLMAKLQNNIGRSIAPTCDATLGDTRCGVSLDGSPTYRSTATIDSTSGRRGFVASGLTAAAGYYDHGYVQFNTGANAGLRMEVKTHTAGGAIDLQLPMPYLILAGDSVTVTAGCDKLKATCKSKFNNVVNFRGFSFVPGQDQVLTVGGQ